MARGITEQDVLAAADALLTRGERPTIERVRQELGRGSPNTVNRHLDAWWATLAQRIKGRGGSALPASLLELCAQLYAGVRLQAQEEAQVALKQGDERLTAALADLRAEKDALLLERAGATAAIDKLAAEMTALRTRNETLASEKAQLHGEIEHLNTSVKNAKAAADASRTALETAQTKHQDEIQRIRGQWEGNEKRWLDEIGHLRDDAKRQRSDHDGQLKALREQLKASDRSLVAALKARTDLEAVAAQRMTMLAKERDTRLQAEAACIATKELLAEFLAKPRSPTSAQARKRAKRTSGPMAKQSSSAQ